MKDQLEYFDYRITDDPEFSQNMFGIPAELQRELPALHHDALKGGERIIRRLKKLLERYPHVPVLKNYLSVAYHNSGMRTEGYKVNHLTVKEHPEYLFGKLNLAHEYFQKEEYEKIPEILGQHMELKELYQERECFHLGEVTGFLKIAIMYFSTIGNLDAAETRYEILEEIAEGHPDTEAVFPYLVKARLDASEKRWEEEHKERISVIPDGFRQQPQTESPPEFIHQEIEWLYENGLRIEKEKLETILSLPREELIQDLVSVLHDSIARFEYFQYLADEEGWQEERMNYVIHAIFLLGELRATNCLNEALETFCQSEPFIEFWYGDFLTGEIWEPIYHLGGNQLDVLKEFVLTPGIDTYARSTVCKCVTQIAHHQPKRRKEIITWFNDLFLRLSGTGLDQNIIDSDFNGLAVCDALKLQAPELLPGIRELYNLGYVGKGICGPYESVERDMDSSPKAYHKLDLLNIYDRYHHIVTTWSGYLEESDDVADETTDTDRVGDQMPFTNPKKTGRNDPCPCGSGKKYKKCCLVV